MSSSKKPQQENPAKSAKPDAATDKADKPKPSGVERDRAAAGGPRPRREDGGEPRVRDTNRKERPPRPNGQGARNRSNDGSGPATRERRDETPKPSAAASAPSGSGTTSGPTIQVKKDIVVAPTWNKGTKGPSFADMVRQKALGSAAAKPAPQQPAAEAPEASAKEVKQHQREEKETEKEKEKQPVAAEAAVQEPSHAAAAAAVVAIVEEEEDEEVVFNPSAAAPAQKADAVVAEPVAPAAPVEVAPPPAAYYVLEVERVERVKLPESVLNSAGLSTGLYTFSGQAGKPPTPAVIAPMPASTQPQAVYRPDAANLGNRAGAASQMSTWNLPTMRTQQQWHPTTGLDYWNTDRNPTSNLLAQQQQQQQQQARFSQHQPGGGLQAQYNAYPAASQQPMRTQNFFPDRLRQEAMSHQQDMSSSAAALRSSQMAASQFARPATSNGGGVW